MKEPKIYFYDTARGHDMGGARLENAEACALLKRQHFLADTRGIKSELFYIRDREKREVDFLTVLDNKPEFLIEVKSSDDGFSPSLRYFAERIPATSVWQLVQNLQRSRTHRLGSIANAAHWLAGLEA